MQINYKAVRAFHRATRELKDQFAIALEADHAVCPDGYGTASIETRYEGHRHDIAHRVGRRFGITANDDPAEHRTRIASDKMPPDSELQRHA